MMEYSGILDLPRELSVVLKVILSGVICLFSAAIDLTFEVVSACGLWIQRGGVPIYCWCFFCQLLQEKVRMNQIGIHMSTKNVPRHIRQNPE